MWDVAIAGGGPTGVLAANLCGQHGLSAVVFDREPDVYDLPRAAALHDDVQRILANAGMLDAVLPSTSEHVGAEFVDVSGKRLTGIEFAGLRTLNGFPPVLAISQPGLERTLRSCLARFERVELRTSYEVREVRPGEDHVDLVVHDRTSGDTRRESARWLIGADGASSFVRKSLGIAWDSLGYDREWLVIDVERDASVALSPFCQQICDPARPTTVIPMPGKLHRWEFQLLPGETRAEMEEPERVWSLLRPWMSREQGRILRAVVYRFHATIASTFRRGRVFLAGDAAHQTPPFLGQGLCTGARDVENLVWKLAAVARGRARDELLDTYTEERRPAAVAMVQHSTNAGKLIEAFADMTITGRPPPPELVAYGYGGGKQLPDLTTGLLAPGESEWVGRLVPQCEVSEGATRGRFDDLVGPRWGIVGLTDPRALLDPAAVRAWTSLDAAFLELSDPAARTLLADDHILAVRPDRVIYFLGRGRCLVLPKVFNPNGVW